MIMKKILYLAVFTAFIMFIGANSAKADWWNNDWQNCINITLNNSQIFGDQIDFPMLVNITTPEILGNTTSIRFIDEPCRMSGNEMPFEIEYNDSSQFLAWVKIPSISNTTENIISVYYNNANATSGENASGVWNTTIYKAVFHMNDYLNDSTIKDSTSNNYLCDKQGSGTPAESTTSKIYKSQDFAEQYINCPSDLSSLTEGSIEFWVNHDLSRTHGYFSRGTGFDSEVLLGITFGDDSQQYTSDGVSISPSASYYGGNGVWSYKSFIFNSDIAYYLNGDFVSSASGGSLVAHSGIFALGKLSFDPSYILDGKMDEFRLLNVAENNDYFKTSYNTQNLSEFYIMGTEENQQLPPTNISNCTRLGRISSNALVENEIIFVNDTYGIYGNYITTQNKSEMYVYNCSGRYVIGNLTDELFWENSTRNDGFNYETMYNQSGLLSFWRFDGSLWLNDSTMNGNNLSVINSVTPNSTALFGQSMYSAGDDNALYLPQSMSDEFFFTDSQSFSLEFLIRPTTFGVYRNLARVHSTDANPTIWLARLEIDNSINFLLYDTLGTPNSCTSNVTITTTDWYLIDVVFNTTDKTSKIYLDGDMVGNCSSPNAFTTTPSCLLIGADTGCGTPFGEEYTGNIDYIKIYNRDLSADEINDSAKAILNQLTSFTEEGEDTTPPNITVLSPIGLFTSSSVYFNVTADEVVDTCLVDWGIGNITMANSSGTWNYINISMPNGNYTADFFCNDTSGNTGYNTTSFEVSVDVTPPNILVISPVGAYGLVPIYFNVTVNEIADTCLVDWGEGNYTMTNSTGNWNYLNSSMPEGNYTAEFFCNDTNGNMGYNITSFEISSTPIPPSNPSIYDQLPAITGQLVITLGFGIMGLFAILTLLGFGYTTATGKPDPETIAKIMIGITIIILMIVAVWTGIVTPP